MIISASVYEEKRSIYYEEGPVDFAPRLVEMGRGYKTVSWVEQYCNLTHKLRESSIQTITWLASAQTD